MIAVRESELTLDGADQFYLDGISMGVHTLSLQPLCAGLPCSSERSSVVRFTVRHVAVAVGNGPLVIGRNAIDCHRLPSDDVAVCCLYGAVRVRIGYHFGTLPLDLESIRNAQHGNCTNIRSNSSALLAFFRTRVNIARTDEPHLYTFLREKMLAVDPQDLEYRLEGFQLTPRQRVWPTGHVPEETTLSRQLEGPDQENHVVDHVALILPADDPFVSYLPIVAQAWQRIGRARALVCVCLTLETDQEAWKAALSVLRINRIRLYTIHVRRARCVLDGLRHILKQELNTAPSSSLWLADPRLLPRCPWCVRAENFHADFTIFETRNANHWMCATGTPYIRATLNFWNEVLLTIPEEAMAGSSHTADASIACKQSANPALHLCHAAPP